MKIDRIKHIHLVGMAITYGTCSAAMTIQNLRCEYLTNPLGIDTLSPRLSWTLASEQRGERQTAYQVLVASSADLLNADTGDLWDSHKVISDESAKIAYAGMANQDSLSTLGLHMLASLCQLRRSECGFTKAIDDVVQRAHTLITLRCQEPLDIKALAAELGVGYSNLRHSFMARVGISPGQHYQNIRIQKAHDLLVNTAKSVKEIAEILGFASAPHFSRQFKQRVGVSPNDWRIKFSGQRQKTEAGSGL